MKIILVIGVLIATLGGCAVVPVDYGYRGERNYYRGDRYYAGDRYSRGCYRDGYAFRGMYGYQDHGQLRSAGKQAPALNLRCPTSRLTSARNTSVAVQGSVRAPFREPPRHRACRLSRSLP